MTDVRLSLAGSRRHPVLLAGPAYPEVMSRLARFFEVEVADGTVVRDRAVLCARLAGKSALMSTRTAGIDASLLQTLPHLKAVCKMTADHADLDLAACSRANVMATNTPDLGGDEPARRQMALAAAENIIAVFGFGRAAGHPPGLLNVDLRCALGCCY